jgi:uncharacterized membrane-anchored protein
MPDSDSQPPSPPAPSALDQPTMSPGRDIGANGNVPGRIRAVPTPRDPGSQQAHVLKQELRGTHIGDRYVRYCRVETPASERTVTENPAATEESLAVRDRICRLAGKVMRILTWEPGTSDAAANESSSTPNQARAAPNPGPREKP